jgi:predicted phosphodiesterase
MKGTGLLLLAGSWVFLAVGHLGGHLGGGGGLPPNVGNWPEVLSRMENLPRERAISFAVVGDSHGSPTFRRILEELKKKEIDFIVHLGDFAITPTREGHEFSLEQVRDVLGPDGPPMIMVMGNHDVDVGFPVGKFEELYGPSSFSFSCGGNLFIVLPNCLPKTLRNGDGDGRSWKKELEKILAERRPEAGRTFLLVHSPPFDPLKPMTPKKAQSLMKSWGTLGVDYLIAGHLHQYARSQLGPTAILVSGGGGGRLREVPTGKFHHAIILRVLGGQVTEELLVVEEAFAPIERLNRELARRVPFLSSLFGHGSLAQVLERRSHS